MFLTLCFWHGALALCFWYGAFGNMLLAICFWQYAVDSRFASTANLLKMLPLNLKMAMTPYLRENT
ncbi:MAG: hypothetical protein AAFQ63_20155, partial [Cyanobacteria bacterium J06621_11]